jgi:hypothetical protein
MNPQTEGSEEKGPTGVPFINDPGKHPAPAQPDEADPEDADIAGMDGSEEPE